MTQSTKNPLTKKVIFLASLGLIIPFFLVSMAFIAVKSDAKNQEVYKQQQLEIIERIKLKEQQEAEASQSVK